MKYENIELLRLQHDLTQGEVADVLGCQREVYRRYEKGTREMPVSVAVTATTDKLETEKNKYDAAYAGYNLLDKSSELTAANNAVKSATTDKERADTKVTKAEKALTVAEDKVEEAIAARDEAYTEAGVSGNADLIARDEAQEEKLAEAYEQELAVQANYEAKEAYDQADANYDKAADLVPTNN